MLRSPSYSSPLFFVPFPIILLEAFNNSIDPMRNAMFYRFFACAAIIGAMTISGCNTDDPDDMNPCPTPTFSIQNNQSSISLYIYSAGHGYFEIQYGSNGFPLGSGTVATVNASSDLGNLNNGTYDIYVRGNCGSNMWSEWSPPTSFLITGGPSGNCPAPSGFSASPSSTQAYLDWFESNYAGYYQVEYGPTGFTFGTGQSINVPSSYTTLTGLTGNTVYDYYVRANCGGPDFSAWTGPHSFVTQ